MMFLAGILSESAPAIGAMNIGASVHGRMRRPEPNGEYPCTVWKNCASRKIEPNIPKYMNRDARFARAKVALRKKRIGSIGCSARSSQATNAATKAKPARERDDDLSARPALLVAADEAPDDPEQPGAGEPEARQVEPTLGAVASPAGASARAGCRTRPIGTLSQKIQCHEIPWTTAPPTSGPKATARPLMPPHAPSAMPRFSAGTAAERIVSVNGITIAPPSPCTARAMLSTSTDGASAAAIEPSGEDRDADARRPAGARSGHRARRPSAAAPRR